MKKGFTLIELLAVITILGILFTLIIPKIIDTLNESEQKSNLVSANGLIDAAQYKHRDNEANGISESLMIDFTNKINDGKLTYDGKKPEKGFINLGESGLITMAVKIGENCYKKDFSTNEIIVLPYDDNTCKYDIYVADDADYDGQISQGDGIQIGTEYFYVIENTGETISALAKYPLYIDGKIGTGIQDELALTSSGSNIQFSNSVYWPDDETPILLWLCIEDDNYNPPSGCKSYPYRYNSNSKVYPYIETYVDYLKQINPTKLSTITGRLIKMEEKHYLDFFNNENANSMSNWIYSTNYWTGSTDYDYVYVINEGNSTTQTNNYNDKNRIRPVIEMPLSVLESDN